MTTIQKIQQIRQSPVHSFWLKNALNSALQRDCCDAASDAKLLAQVLLDVCNEHVGLPLTVLEERAVDKHRDGAMGICAELGID